MRKQKGITIVTLAITILVLAILTGISVSTLLGDEGIIKSSRNAKENMDATKIEEEEKINYLYRQVEDYDAQFNPNVDSAMEQIENELFEFKKAMAEYIEEAGGVKPRDTDDSFVFGESILGLLQQVTKEATATAEDIAEGKTAYVNGEFITGSASQSEVLLMYGEAGSNKTVTHTIPAGGKKCLLVTGIAGMYSSTPGTLNSSDNISNITLEFSSYSGKENYYGSGFKITSFDINTEEAITVSVTYANYADSGKNWYAFIRY